MDNLEICKMSAIGLRRAIGTKKLSPVEVVDALLDRINTINPKINAYCTIAADNARKEAKKAEQSVMKGKPLGALHGVPVSVKDLIFTSGIRTTSGSRMHENFIPDRDAIVVERLKAAGAIIIGKTNTPEFGWAGITTNTLFGTTRNPWNLNYTSGGSSGGAAAAVAACLGPIAIGGDAGGSIRIPSSMCGVFGLKPSFGRVPYGPAFPGLWEGLLVTGPITRTVADAALVMEVISGYDERCCYSIPQKVPHYRNGLKGNIKELKIAWSPDFGTAEVDTSVLSLTESAVKVFVSLGCRVDMAHPDTSGTMEAFSTQTGAAIVAQLYDKLGEWGKYFDPGLISRIEQNANLLASDYVKARMKHLEFWEKMRVFFEKYDLLITPTLAVPPFKVGIYRPEEINGKKIESYSWVPFTFPFNITGQPAASVPCGFTDAGLPVGLQIVGKRYDEATVLKAAAAFEKVRSWSNRIPQLN
jgi:aspartyl-tRNA(Asn)/glutamyl-tRNA(Gln) amidotransferase subunit A